MRDEVPGSVVPRMQTAATGRDWQERLTRWTIELVQLGKPFSLTPRKYTVMPVQVCGT